MLTVSCCWFLILFIRLIGFLIVWNFSFLFAFFICLLLQTLRCAFKLLIRLNIFLIIISDLRFGRFWHLWPYSLLSLIGILKCLDLLLTRNNSFILLYNSTSICAQTRRHSFNPFSLDLHQLHVFFFYFRILPSQLRHPLLHFLIPLLINLLLGRYLFVNLLHHFIYFVDKSQSRRLGVWNFGGNWMNRLLNRLLMVSIFILLLIGSLTPLIGLIPRKYPIKLLTVVKFFLIFSRNLNSSLTPFRHHRVVRELIIWPLFPGWKWLFIRTSLLYSIALISELVFHLNWEVSAWSTSDFSLR